MNSEQAYKIAKMLVYGIENQDIDAVWFAVGELETIAGKKVESYIDEEDEGDEDCPRDEGKCDQCGAFYELGNREGRCGDCGNCANHCTHEKVIA
jgi:Zn finger protein HypA/HybF involved in hydrogenase expression